MKRAVKPVTRAKKKRLATGARALFPNRISEHLTRLDKSQVWLARRLDISESQLSRVIHGRHLVTVDTALRVSRAMGTTVEEVFG